MAMEVVCGNCHGRLLVEQTGVIVACPHCGAHLQIGDPASAAPSTLQPASPGPFDQIMSADAGSPQGVPPLSTDPKLQNAADALPEIILTPPSVRKALSGDELGFPAATPEPAVSPAPENDVWLPRIDLAMPKAVASEPPPREVSLESSTMIFPGRRPAMDAVDSMPAAIFPTAKAEATGIWSREDIENSLSDQAAMLGSDPEFLPSPGIPDFVGETSVRDPLAASTLILLNPPVDSTEQQLPVQVGTSVTTTTEDRPPQLSVDTTSVERSSGGVPWYLFLVVVSYASAITLALIYVLMRGTPTLDLPDVVPEFNKNGKVTWKWINETPLPAAYRVKLGESKQYGNIKITPVKVTRGPLQFVHFGDAKQIKPPTAVPVLKLWVKFENVSTDQTFPALDEQLLYQRANDKQNAAQYKTNNYVCQQSERKRDGKRVSVYTMTINGEWLLKDQNLNSPLGPHQSWETYIPTNDEDLSSLTGPLTWRLQFRKGYNPTSFRGVTTLVEVEFDSKDIQAES